MNTYPAMILALVAINQPFTIWLMRGFFVDVPHELYEAAEIDGCRCVAGVLSGGVAGGAARMWGDGAVQFAAGV